MSRAYPLRLGSFKKSNMVEELELGHREIMDSNNITQSDLPKEIESKILSLTMLIGSYESTPSEELKERIEHQSAKIGHEILDYIEEDYPEEPDLQNSSVDLGQQSTDQVEQVEQVQQTNTEKRSSNGLFNFFGF
jgi:hypothetical protein